MVGVDYSSEQGVAVVTLDRPPVNALSRQMADELEAAFGRAEQGGERALVITGRPHFAAGADISGFQEAFSRGEQDRLAGRLSEVIRRLERLPMPTIAAVFGFALGGGLELAMGADFRYLAEDARMGQPEIKLGIIPGAGGTQRLPRLVGFSRAKEMIYSGRHVESQEALEIGLADKVLPPERLLEAALDAAAAFAGGPTVALAAAKRAINEGWGRPIDEGLEVEAGAFAEAFRTEDARAGVAAFLEKREPEFKGG
ncbi:MAG: enoyl-CoA hydratase-related protein [Actinomycetota bacterium]|nr:enoyl-CoA hydratase-related protein [Actinomycetota bacterium]